MIKELLKDLFRPAYYLLFHIEVAILWRISPKRLASKLYRRAHHRELDWEHPQDVDEKINWLKFNSDTSQWITLADKYRVRQYVEECGLSDMLVKLYGKWDKADDIDWESLPQQFVMKTNNGSGDVLICRDKSRLDVAHWTKRFRHLLAIKFGNDNAEPHYNKICPCIVAEELLDNRQQAVKSSSLVDYKIWSFDGSPAYIWVCWNRTPHSCEVKTYDLDWNEHPEFSIDTNHYRLSSVSIPRPKSLDKMLNAASRLSKGFPVVRVDLYEVDGKPYFGEMTFTPASGYNFFYTQEFLNILGAKVKIGTDARNMEENATK